jgi:uncharacterized protein
MSENLWEIICFQNIDSINTLLNFGEDINFRNKHDGNKTLLHFAICRGWFDIAEFLISRGADVNAADSDQITPIHVSIQHQSLELTQKLIEHGANINWHCGCGSIDTPLHRAVYTKQPKMVEFLISYGASIDEIDDFHRTPIETAAKRGDRAMVNLLLAHGAAKSLYVGAAIGDLQMIEQYLKAGGDPNIRLGHGYGCPLIYVAAAHNQLEVANLLIQSGAEINMECEQDDFAILAACRHGSCEMVRLLVENGARTDVYNFGGNMVDNAAYHGRTDIVQLLIKEYNFPVSSASAAASGGHIETLEFLISQGASIPKDAIFGAAKNKHHEMIKFLADRNVDPNIKVFGQNALVNAAIRGDALMVQTLLSVGANVNFGKDFEDWTALHYAASGGHLEVVRLLVDAGADVNVRIKRGDTPLQLAGLRRADDVIDVLIKRCSQ